MFQDCLSPDCPTSSKYKGQAAPLAPPQNSPCPAYGPPVNPSCSYFPCSPISAPPAPAGPSASPLQASTGVPFPLAVAPTAPAPPPVFQTAPANEHMICVSANGEVTRFGAQGSGAGFHGIVSPSCTPPPPYQVPAVTRTTTIPFQQCSSRLECPTPNKELPSNVYTYYPPATTQSLKQKLPSNVYTYTPPAALPIFTQIGTGTCFPPGTTSHAPSYHSKETHRHSSQASSTRGAQSGPAATPSRQGRSNTVRSTRSHGGSARSRPSSHTHSSLTAGSKSRTSAHENVRDTKVALSRQNLHQAVSSHHSSQRAKSRKTTDRQITPSDSVSQSGRHSPTRTTLEATALAQIDWDEQAGLHESLTVQNQRLNGDGCVICGGHDRLRGAPSAGLGLMCFPCFRQNLNAQLEMMF